MNNDLYNSEFYNNQMDGSFRSAKIYVEYLINLFDIKSVVDFGCGRGTWLHAFELLGVKNLVGLDGSWNNQENMVSNKIQFSPTNLNEDIRINRKFDLAISLEVAEHLEPQSSARFIKNMVECSDLIMFGAAFIAQPGTDHINTRLHSDWAKMFLEHSYNVYDIFRPRFCGDINIEPWYQQNTFLYVRDSSIWKNILTNMNIHPTQNIKFLDLIHPWLYKHYLTKYNALNKRISFPFSV